MHPLLTLPASARRTVPALFLLLCALPVSQKAWAETPAYTFQTVLYPLSSNPIPSAINNDGVFVGQLKDKDAFTYSVASGFQEVLPPPGDVEVNFAGINNSGQVAAVGTGGDKNGTLHSYIWTTQGFSAPDPAGTIYAGLDDENNRVGEIVDTATNEPIALYDTTSFNVPGSGTTYLSGVANTVNHKKLAVGTWYDSSTDAHPFLRDVLQGTNTTILLPAGVYSAYAMGINSFGTVVGYYSHPGNGQYRCFVRTLDGRWSDVQVPNATETYGFGINDHGTIVGSYRYSGGPLAGFVATVSNGYTMGDVKSALKIASGLGALADIESFYRDDVDGDGKVDLRDVGAMEQKMAGLEANP